MQKIDVESCLNDWSSPDYCRSFPDCKGWGCRLIQICPDKLPSTKKERAKLFSRVYAQAEKQGVLECPHYHSTIIDEVVERNPELINIINHFDQKLSNNCLTQISESYNPMTQNKLY